MYEAFTARCIPSERVDEKLTAIIANLQDQFNQFRERAATGVSTADVNSVTVERLEQTLEQARQNLEAHLESLKHDMMVKLQQNTDKLHQYVNDTKLDTMRKVNEDTWKMVQKVEQIDKKINSGGPFPSNSNFGNRLFGDDQLREEINQTIISKIND